MGLWSTLKRKRQRADNAGLVAALVSLSAEDSRRLVEKDYIVAGHAWGVEPADLHAFALTESAGQGFGPNSRLIINYEKHVASRNTKPPHAYISEFPEFYARHWGGVTNLPSWHPYFMSQPDRWDLLARSADVNFMAALRGTSWGSFQVLGENAEMIGFNDAFDMVKYMYSGEAAHLDCAIRFLRARNAMEDLQAGNMRQVFAAYNGEANVDDYDRKFSRHRKRTGKLYA